MLAAQTFVIDTYIAVAVPSDEDLIFGEGIGGKRLSIYEGDKGGPAFWIVEGKCFSFFQGHLSNVYSWKKWLFF